MLDGWRLAVGTLTAIPVKPPSVVDRRTARTAMLLAPFAVLPLGIGVWLVGWLMHRYAFASPATGFVLIGFVVLGTRAFHIDGLADTADGLTSSYDRERSLEVMKSGASGPAGVAAIVLVLGLQLSSINSLVLRQHGTLVAGLVVCLSRLALVVTCERGVPGATNEGLGAPFAGAVPHVIAAALWIALLAAVIGMAHWLGLSIWFGVAGVVAARVVLALLLHRSKRRLGGVTGDVYGAAIEITLALLLAGLAGGPVLLAG